MSETKKKQSPKKRSKRAINKRKRKRAHISISIFGLLLILGVLGIYYYIFFVEGRILFFFPGLAQKVTFTDLLEEPEVYDYEWIKIRGRIQHTLSQRLKDTAELLPEYYPTQTNDSDSLPQKKFHKKDSKKSDIKIRLEIIGNEGDKSFRFISLASGTIVDAVGVFKIVEKYHRNMMILQVITVMGYERGLLDWVGTSFLIMPGLLGIATGIFLLWLALPDLLKGKI